MQFTGIKETSLYIQDLDRTEAFYNITLGLEVVTKKEGRHIFFRIGSSVLLCFLADVTKGEEKVPHYGKGHIHIAFEVPADKYAEAKSWIESKGIEIEEEQHWRGNYYSFYFRDPDGHLLEIVPEGMWG